MRVGAGPTGAVVEARAPEAKRPEEGAQDDRAGVLVAPGGPAVRVGALVGQGCPHLFLDHRLLEGAQEVLGLGEGEADGVGAEGPSFESEHLPHHGRAVIVAFDQDLHGDLHAAPSWIANRRAS